MSISKLTSHMVEKFALLALPLLLSVQVCTASSLSCSCSPLIYRWTLDLSNPCPTEIPMNDGVGRDSFCKILTTTTDLPVKVTKIQFLEYGETLGDLATYYEETGEWLDGDEMSVESITSGDPSIYTTAAGFELDGYTEAGEKVVLQWIVDYTNECEVDPYENISSIAWLQFSDQTPALQNTCRYSTPKNTKSSKSSKDSKSPKTPKSPKSSWSYKSSKISKAPKSAKSSKDSKESKAEKSKSSKRQKSSKESKADMKSKSPKGQKSSKDSNSIKSSWSYKSSKSSKDVKTSKSTKSKAWSKGGYRN